MRKCDICGKGSIMRGGRKKLRGKYNPTPKTRKYPNLQKSRDNQGKRALVCANCLRTTAKKQLVN
jgi:ribosomal protein L28